MLPTSAEGDRVSNNVTIGNASGKPAITASFSIDTVDNGNDTLIMSGGTDVSMTIGDGLDTATDGDGNNIKHRQ